MKLDGGHVFGYWVDGNLICPWCFENLGQAAKEPFTVADWFDAHFGKCHQCRWPLWGLYQYEKYLERKPRVEKQFDISDDLPDLNKIVLQEEVELVNLRAYNADRSIFDKMVIDSTYDGSTISEEYINKLLDIPVKNDN